MSTKGTNVKKATYRYYIQINRGVTRRKVISDRIWFIRSNLKQCIWPIKKEPLTNTKCRLWRVESSGCALNAAHSVLYEWAFLQKYVPLFGQRLLWQQAIVTVCVFAAGTFYFILSPGLNIYLLQGFLLTVLHCLQIGDLNQRLPMFLVTPI